MERAIWKGNISFGLINIPVTLHSAEQRYDLHFKLMDSRNHAKIRYERVNEVTGEEVPWNNIVKGYEYENGNFVLLTDKDFEKVNPKAAHSIEIEDFIERGEMDCFYFDKPYVLLPQKKAEKGYVLLRETLNKTKKVGIARVMIRTRPYIAALMARGPALVLNVLRFEAELKDVSKMDVPKGNIKQFKISDKEIEMAEKFIEAMTVEWKPAKYKDEYRETLMKWIKKKAKSEGLTSPVETEKDEGVVVDKETNTIDIMHLLKKSLQAKESQKKKAA
jgi:DNA end-binding protein Ku